MQGPGGEAGHQRAKAATEGQHHPKGRLPHNLALLQLTAPRAHTLTLCSATTALLALPWRCPCIRSSVQQEGWPHCTCLTSLTVQDQLVLTSSR